MASGQHITSRSSLFSHRFPTFYACYLLKSIQTPLSKATYIGSTPNPHRRIRQHNGEITQGASKTKHHRPWVMQMIVHGFPSRLAALQFEWAWQHPYKSRHLRDSDGNTLISGSRKSKSVKANIQIVRMMLCSHPYSRWPLHVKLFTEDAVKAWNDAAKSPIASTLPPGFTYSIELEGVDGKSKQIGSGRRGPIDVEDEQFTSIYLAKNTSLMATFDQLKCSVCSEILTNYATDSLRTTLCPNIECTSVSHLACLSKQFLAKETARSSLIPRGGECTSCRTYALWGDIVRGCYRRVTAGVCDPENGGISDDLGEMYDTDVPEGVVTIPVNANGGKPNAGKGDKPARKKTVHVSQSSEGEQFDLDVSSSGESNTPRRRGRPRKVSPPASVRPVVLPTPESNPPAQRPRGRPPKVPLANAKTTSSPTTAPSAPRSKNSIKSKLPKSQSVRSRSSSESSAEHFDFDGIVDSSDESNGKILSPGKAVHKSSTQSTSSLPPLLRSRKERLRNLHPEATKVSRVIEDAVASVAQSMISLTVASPPQTSRKPITQYVEISD